MDIKSVTGNFSVSPQIDCTDIKAIHDAGFRTIICHRPDGEAPQQTNHEQVKAEAESVGLTFHYQPVVSGRLTPEDIGHFRQLLQSSPPPILAYCRTGTRSVTLWAKSVTDTLSVTDILKWAQNAGYDLSPCFSEADGR